MWTLLTDEFDSMENQSPDCTQSRPLQSLTFHDAKQEAYELYQSLEKYHPGAYANHRWFPRNPRLVFQLDETRR